MSGFTAAVNQQHTDVVMARACVPLCADIKTRDDVLAMGIDKYNEECRSIVMR